MISVDAKVLRGSLRALLKVAAHADKSNLQAIHVVAGNDHGGLLQLTATDGHRVVRILIKCETTSEFETMIRAPCAKRLMKVLDMEGSYTLKWINGALESDHTGKLDPLPPDHSFPPVDKVIPPLERNQHAGAIGVNPVYMVDAFQVFSDVFGKGQAVRMGATIRSGRNLEPIRIDGYGDKAEIICVIMPRRI